MVNIDLPERIKQSFSMIDSDIATNLCASNEEYADLMHQISALKRKNPFIDCVLENEGELSLSASQHAEVVRCLALYRRMEELERLHIYFRGHTDAYAYLKQIGAL